MWHIAVQTTGQFCTELQDKVLRRFSAAVKYTDTALALDPCGSHSVVNQHINCYIKFQNIFKT